MSAFCESECAAAVDSSAMRCSGAAGLADQRDASLDLDGRAVDQRLDLPGRSGRSLRQCPGLEGDHDETFAGIASTRRLDTGIQREQVGPEGDLVDHADNLGNFAGRFLAAAT